MAEVDYFETNEKDIDLIKPLWEKLVEHHKSKSKHFVNRYAGFTFEARKAELLKEAGNGMLHIILVKNTEKSEIIGYCVSSLSKDGGGEIQSIYVEEDYRKHGIGDGLMRGALNWLDSHGAKTKKIGVAGGNEEAFGFYGRYGFFPKLTVLEQV